ncbi:tRNA pseudouridine synthase [Dirofilaria immitis]
MSDLWFAKGSSNIYIYLELLQIMNAIMITIWLVAICGLRKGERKDLIKASKIISMPEIRKFKLDLSEKLQQEIDVDLDVALNDIGKEASMTENAAQKMITQTTDVIKNLAENVFSEAMQKTKKKSEEYKRTRKEESTQSSLKKERMLKKSIHNQSDSRITNGLEEKQCWKQSIGSHKEDLNVFAETRTEHDQDNDKLQIVNPSAEKNHNKRKTDPTQTEADDRNMKW